MLVSSSKSAGKLYDRYRLIQDDRLTKTLEMIQSFIGSLPQLPEKNNGAKRFIARLFSPDCQVFTDKASGIDTMSLLASVFLAIHDINNLVGDLEEAQEKFVNGLYRIQREYNFSGREDEEDKPALPERTFYRLVEILEGIHPDIVYVEGELTEYAIAAQHPLKDCMLSFLSDKRDLMSLSQANRFFRELTLFKKLIKLAASGEQKDIDVVVAMVKANPSLLLERGDVVTRGGTKIINTTVYEFFLGSGHTEALEAMRDANLFALLPGDGEMERMHQYDLYRPHIERLRHDVRAYVTAYERAPGAEGMGGSAYHSNYEELGYRPAYDLRDLIDLLINRATSADVKAELEQTERYSSELRNEMCKFREAINESQRERREGMHYAHYTTIMQVLHLLYEKKLEISQYSRDFNRCILVFSQIFGYLQLVGLPARERFAFARDFDDKKLSAVCNHNNYGPRVALRDFDFSNSVCTGLGFNFGIAGREKVMSVVGVGGMSLAQAGDFFKSYIEQKLDALALMQTPPQPTERPRSRCVLL